MTRTRHVRLYRLLTLLYPPAFRREYGEDLEALFNHQLIDEGATRSWLRALRDLALSVPTQHLEATMHQPQPALFTTACVALSGTGLLLAAVTGTGPATIALIVFSLIGLTLAGLIHRQAQPIAVRRPTTRWKTLLLTGAIAAVAVIGFMNLAPAATSPPDWLWYTMMASLIVSITMTLAGALGFATTHFGRALNVDTGPK